jgi:5-(carboxyamino)imidazole ribonucleotide synthase
MVSNKKIGILGGGQLGKMLCEAASPWHLNIHVLDKDEHMSAAPYCTAFSKGNFKNYNDVFEFGKGMDIVTIEIEHVNLEALVDLQKAGIEIHPNPQALYKIVDKGLQKLFYRENDIPTAGFILLDSKSEIVEAVKNSKIKLPFVQKTRKEGYDGRGVQVIRTQDDLKKIADVPSVIENLVELEAEVAVITSRNKNGQVESFAPVNMKFKDEANLLDVLECPAGLTKEKDQMLIDISEKIIKKLGICGVLAIEFFLDKKGEIYVNEIAPRPHNSGHHTIENNIVSQYQQHLRGILNLPLIKPRIISPAVMINVLGEDGYQGTPQINGLELLFNIPNAYFHWYGKKETKPFRKMGHITFTGPSVERAREIALSVRQELKITTKNN